MSNDFQLHLANLGIKAKVCSVRNPQSNAVLERVHDTMKSAMRTELNTNPPQTLQEATDIIDTVFASAQFAVRSKAYDTHPCHVTHIFSRKQSVENELCRRRK
eukprot:jgi/Psemu1/14409/gm1.14409_g